MKTLLVATALLLASAHGFNVSPRLSKLQSFRSVTSLKGTTTSSPTTVASINGDTKSVDELAAEMLDSSRSAATAQQQQPIIINVPPPPSQPNATDSMQSSLVYFAIAFVGLPIWLLLSSQVFGGVQQQQIQPTVTQPTMVQPTSTTVTLPKEEVIPSAPSATKVVSQPITKAEVRGLFNLWNDALHTLDPDMVAARYSKEGVLLPTLSGKSASVLFYHVNSSVQYEVSAIWLLRLNFVCLCLICLYKPHALTKLLSSLFYIHNWNNAHLPDVPRNDYNAIRDYFVHFLEKKPDGKILEGEIFVGNNWAQDAGIYEFKFEDGSKVKARYSFIYVYEDGKWMISHHHSSLMPEEVVRPTPITKEEVRGLFGLWNDALATGEPQQVAARYTKDAVLLPTLSDRARYDTEGIADYFVHFLEKKPRGRIVEGNIKIGPNWAQDAGIYEFTFQDGSSVQGRYSFVYSYENGEWKISNHHSSIMPEKAVAALKKVSSQA